MHLLKERANKLDLTGANSSKLYKKLEKTQKRITVASAKAKGRNLQSWACDKLAELLDLTWDQQDDQSLLAFRPMGQAGTDVILRGEAYTRFQYDPECKSVESLNLVTTVEQARNNTKPGRDWLIIHRKKALPETIVMMGWDAFARLWKKGNP